MGYFSNLDYEMKNTPPDERDEKQATLFFQIKDTVEISRDSDTEAVIVWLQQQQLPEGTITERVGAWVWIEFPEKPETAIRKMLIAAGFRWINKRQKWAHCCNVRSFGSVTDPKEKYDSERI